MLGYGEIHAHAFFYHHQMASHLAEFAPSRFLKSFRRLPAGNVGKARHKTRWRLESGVGRRARK